MKKILLHCGAAVLLSLPLPLFAQQWSLSGGTGPFAFGRFAERTLRASTGQGAISVSRIELTAKTRPGVFGDIQRDLGDRFAVRLEGTFTRAPLAVKSENGSGVGLDAGHIDVSTWILPLVLKINPRGAVRFHIMAGPALATYHISRRVAPGQAIVPFEGTRARFGGAAAAGVSWWFHDRFAIEGQIADIVTASPFERTDFIAADIVSIPKPENIHTTVGLRWRF